MGIGNIGASGIVDNVLFKGEYSPLHPEVRQYNRIKMAKNISNNCNLKFDDVRYIITNLKKTKFLVNKNVEQQKSITDFFKN